MRRQERSKNMNNNFEDSNSSQVEEFQHVNSKQQLKNYIESLRSRPGSWLKNFAQDHPNKTSIPIPVNPQQSRQEAQEIPSVSITSHESDSESIILIDLISSDEEEEKDAAPRISYDPTMFSLHQNKSTNLNLLESKATQLSQETPDNDNNESNTASPNQSLTNSLLIDTHSEEGDDNDNESKVQETEEKHLIWISKNIFEEPNSEDDNENNDKSNIFNNNDNNDHKQLVEPVMMDENKSNGMTTSTTTTTYEYYDDLTKYYERPAWRKHRNK